MSRAEAFLAGAVQIAGPLTRVQQRIVSVKLHPDAVSVLQLSTDMDEWKMERLVTWSLKAPVGRNPVQENYPLLVDEVSSAAAAAGVNGVDAGISLPASLFDTRVLTLPYFAGEDISADAEEPGFWEEFDSELTDLAGKVTRYQVLYSNENEDRTLVLFSAISLVELDRYRGLLLDANLLPVYLENELFSLINGVYARLSIEDTFKPLTIFHLCPGNNIVVGYARGRLAIQQVQISDFDEALLMELEQVDDVSGDFWEEVAIRLSEQLKQAIAFMAEEQDFQRPDKIFLVSEYKEQENTANLFMDRLDMIRVVPYDAMGGVDVLNENARYIDYFRNPSVFTTAIGLATQGLNIDGKTQGSLHRRLIDMNFLEDAPIIRRSRQLVALNRILSVSIIGVMMLSGGLLGYNTMPAFMQAWVTSEQYDIANSVMLTQSVRRQGNENKLLAANEVNAKILSNVGQRGFTKFFEILPSIIPASAELESLAIDERGRVTLIGLAVSNMDINDIKRNFRTERFSRRDPSITSERVGKLWRFQLIADLTRVE